MAFEYDQESNKITCPRSNNGSLEVSVTGIEMAKGDVVEMYIMEASARRQKLRSMVVSPVNGRCNFSLESGNTDILPPGRYLWNLRIVTLPQYDEHGNLTTASAGGNAVTVWNYPPDFVVLEV
jgi:hypothetical protein